MAVDDAMTVDERRKYLRKMQKRYEKSPVQQKGRLLDEIQAVTQLHRKSIIRLLRNDLERKPRRRQRGACYGRQVAAVVAVISESLDHVCAERLHPNLVWIAKHLAHHGELQLNSELMTRLETISVSTLRRMLARTPRDRPRLPRKPPERANRLSRHIPAGRIPWQEQQPGHFETDLVHHCGISASGHYVHTLQLVDVATGWSERVAMLGRSYLAMQDAFQRIQARLPFPLLEIHPDNGNEFLNYHLLRFWKQTFAGVALSRSRPWHKNDNRFVEQKNDTLVRAYVGYDRLDRVQQVNLLNQLYDKMWLYYNFFQPVTGLRDKIVQSRGPAFATIRRRFDQAKTPFDRVSASGVLSRERLAQLLARRQATNPRQLRQEIYGLLDQLFALPCAAPGASQDVYETLFASQKPAKGAAIRVTLSNDRTIPVR